MSKCDGIGFIGAVLACFIGSSFSFMIGKKKIETTLDDKLNANIEHNQTEEEWAGLKTYEDVIGGPEKELFYEIDGHKAYLEVDGVPVEYHFQNISIR